jgi:hypothetical protein
MERPMTKKGSRELHAASSAVLQSPLNTFLLVILLREICAIGVRNFYLIFVAQTMVVASILWMDALRLFDLHEHSRIYEHLSNNNTILI